MPITESLRTLSSILDFIRWGSSEFQRNQLSFSHGFNSALDEAKFLSLSALHLPYDWPEEYMGAVLTLTERKAVIDMLNSRVETRRPVAYLTNSSWFCDLEFFVDERVLIPRSPIAELIAKNFEPWVDSDNVGSILDLCTGSGCIAIACQYAFMDAQVVAADISAEALQVAKINCEKHQLGDYLKLYQSDLFDGIPKQQFDIIVTNPPYVDAQDMADLTQEFFFEPEIGLSAGDDGLEMVRRILLAAVDYLTESGTIFIEVGNTQMAMMEVYDFLPMMWVDFEFGGAGVCCIQAKDLKAHREEISAMAQD